MLVQSRSYPRREYESFLPDKNCEAGFDQLLQRETVRQRLACGSF